MDPITQQAVLATAGAAGGDKVYVDDVFSTYLFTGDTNNPFSIDNGLDLDGKGGMVWFKGRKGTYRHQIYDTERGRTKYFWTHESDASSTNNNVNGGITSFNNNGFSLGLQTFHENLNGQDMVSWSWRKAPGFFDIVTYTGNGTAGKTVAHSLGSVPGMIIVKCTSTNGTNWRVYHRSLGPTKAVFLDLTLAANTSIGHWNDTAPTSTQFTLGSSNDVNNSGDTYVAYIFAHDDASFGTAGNESIIKCGSFNIPGTGTFDVNLGFEPQYILYKQIAGPMGTPDWHIHDTMRGLAQTNFNRLYANTTTAENPEATEGLLTVNPLGFKSTSSAHNAGDYIYMAIRRPHKPPTAGTEVFAAQAARASSTGSADSVTFTSNFPVDLFFQLGRGGDAGNAITVDRLRGGTKYLKTNSNAAESSTIWKFDSNKGVYISGGSSVSSSYGANMFKRAPGFMDVVAYKGNSTVRTITHGLGVVPEFMLVKNRDFGWQWCGYSTVSGAGKSMKLSADVAPFAPGFWNATAPTSSVFTVNANDDANANGDDFIAYLFASLPGISKIGSYTGVNNTTVTVDCGFTSGPRFLLIKRTDATGGWQVWDSARGINSGTNSYDPYLFLNTTAAESVYGDYIDPTTSGFTIKPAATAAGLNTTGGTYFFFAIA
jgi:hypothetical protein